MINQLFKLTERKVKYHLIYYLSFCLLISCNKQDEINCSEIEYSQDISFSYDIGALTDASLSIFPNNLPTSSTFKNNFNQINTLAKSNLMMGKNTWIYHSEIKKEPCYEYKKLYNKSVTYEAINLVPVTQPNFLLSYARTRYIKFQNYQNLNSETELDSTYEIVTVTLSAPLNSYSFIVPLGDVSQKLENYIYYNTITISGASFNNIYHIYSDSMHYNTNKIVPQGLYYNENEGLVGYYLSNGELWIKQ
jgi:hypothetical protein